MKCQKLIKKSLKCPIVFQSFGKLLKKYVSDADIFYVKEKNANGQNVVETAYAFVNYPGNESVVVSSGKDEDIQHQNNYQNSLTFVQLSELSDTVSVIYFL